MLIVYIRQESCCRAGAHHVMLSVCMFFFCVGDAVSQAAQSFLPSVIGRPAAAQRLGRQLMTTGVFVGIVNCAAAGTPEVSRFLRVFSKP